MRPESQTTGWAPLIFSWSKILQVPCARSRLRSGQPQRFWVSMTGQQLVAASIDSKDGELKGHDATAGIN